MDASDVVVGFGDRLYRVERPWGVLPAELGFGEISKIATDSQGCVYVVHRADPPVIVFDRTGAYLRSWGAGAIVDVHGIFITADDRVFIVDRDGHQLLAYDTRGTLLFAVGERHRPRFGAPFNHPTDPAVAPDGDIYVADGYGNSMVHRFSGTGEHKMSWGRWGRGPGEFTTPHGIWVLGDGRVLVGDRENDRVQVFDPNGEYLAEWVGFYHPMDIYVNREGLIFVSDQVPRVTVLTDDGAIVGSFKPVKDQPHGMRGDNDGNIFFVETVSRDITKLTPIG